MKLEEYVYRGQKRLRCGYTTGSCAAAAAKAAAVMLLSEKQVEEVSLMTPKGILLRLTVQDVRIGRGEVSCAIQKDSGDDPDITNGVLVYAHVTRIDQDILVEGGEGVGRVTRAGLKCVVGEAAINPGPRELIIRNVQEVCREYAYPGGMRVRISVPDGVELAKKTFNPRLGIEGGISILGSTGIVEPMSERALIETIRAELTQMKANGAQVAAVVPGNYGETFLHDRLSLPCRAVQCSNYIGDMLDLAVELQLDGILLVGHIGKLVKLAGGIMNTHSRYADGRMEILAAHAALHGADTSLIARLMDCVATDEALSILDGQALLYPVMDTIMKKISGHMDLRVHGSLQTAAVAFSDAYGVLGQTDRADGLIQRLREEDRK
ncbi:cobalt-precorrin-5B (C(1))-methyltransferase CbiD [Clostridium sp. D33t1_170424_F3]|uniref:cobalt-precorrin-5B (C(1))-methyltransferase CbiD n=1 Tax=Clostridium sp. D33t1_170424_F3 TaxID=2787099 RepID=UPI00256FF9F1|nr:cobalt-precorrin-5B (C(1))-methyltransferase CbiD [Clostridium sp. D33t1_170424_F3]